MSKLTQIQTKKLETIRANLNRAVKYMNDPKIVAIARAIDPSNAIGNSYLVKNPAACDEYTPPAIRLENKNIGSDIVGLYTALTLINEFLENPECKIIITQE